MTPTVIPPITVGHASALTIFRYEPHPIANLLPSMETAQWAALTNSIRASGLIDDIVRFEGKILDGRARLCGLHCIRQDAAISGLRSRRRGRPRRLLRGWPSDIRHLIERLRGLR
jgi:hypothetical protein